MLSVTRNLFTSKAKSFVGSIFLRRHLSALHDDNRTHNQKIIATDKLVKPMERVDGKGYISLIFTRLL